MDDFEDVEEEDESKTTYPCLFCGENFDLLELWCHIDEDHSVEGKTGICPLCDTWVGTNLGEHISAQHRNILKISFRSLLLKLFRLIVDALDLLPFAFFYFLFFLFKQCLLTFHFFLLCHIMNCVTRSFTIDHSQHKSGHHKLEPYRTLSRKDLKDGDEYWQSFSAGTSTKISVSKTARDPWLSFLTNVAAGDEREKLQPDSSSGVSLEEEHPKESVLVRDVQPSLSDRDQIGKAQRSKFVQELFISTILDP